jgi:hypothetical protein
VEDIKLKEILDYLQNNKTRKQKEILKYLNETGILHLLEAGREIRIYKFTSFSGYSMKLFLYWDGVLEYYLEELILS